jgi:hypothetical protein
MLRDTWFYVKVALSLFIVALVMAIFVDPAGAAKRPGDGPAVTIAAVQAHSEGLYVVTLANGDRLMVSPATTKTPAPEVGRATKPDNLRLVQGRNKYTIRAIVYREEQP